MSKSRLADVKLRLAVLVADVVCLMLNSGPSSASLQMKMYMVDNERLHNTMTRLKKGKNQGKLPKNMNY